MRMPCSFATAVETKGSCATTSMPNARARRATSIPTLPRPTIPSVLPLSSVPCSDFFSHFPGMHQLVGAADVAGHRQHQRQSVFGHGDGIGAGSVHHRDALAGGGIKVDVVDANARASDHPQLVGMFEKLGIDLHRRADDERVRRLQLRRQLAVELVRA